MRDLGVIGAADPRESEWSAAASSKWTTSPVPRMHILLLREHSHLSALRVPFSLPVRSAITIASANQGGLGADDSGNFISIPTINMDYDDYSPIFEAYHGAIQGLIKEPYWCDKVGNHDLFEEWLIEFWFCEDTDGRVPADDFNCVLQDLLGFLKEAETRRASKSLPAQ